MKNITMMRAAAAAAVLPLALAACSNSVTSNPTPATPSPAQPSQESAAAATTSPAASATASTVAGTNPDADYCITLKTINEKTDNSEGTALDGSDNEKWQAVAAEIQPLYAQASTQLAAAGYPKTSALIILVGEQWATMADPAALASPDPAMAERTEKIFAGLSEATPELEKIETVCGTGIGL